MEKKTEEYIAEFAKKTIIDFVKYQKIDEIPKNYPEELDEKKGVFVTLQKNEKLRGCIGICDGKRRIVENLRDAAIESCKDPRFFDVERDELLEIDFEISILTKEKIIDAKNSEDLLEKITPKKEGIIIEKNGRSALFLPQVWDELPEKDEFLCYLCLKAGLPEDAWKNNARVYKFHAEIIKGKIR